MQTNSPNEAKALLPKASLNEASYGSSQSTGRNCIDEEEAVNDRIPIGIPTGSSTPMVFCCPACRVGHLQNDFTWPGVLCAILLFPIGLICCFLMRQQRCPYCGAIYS